MGVLLFMLVVGICAGGTFVAVLAWIRVCDLLESQIGFFFVLCLQFGGGAVVLALGCGLTMFALGVPTPFTVVEVNPTP